MTEIGKPTTMRGGHMIQGLHDLIAHVGVKNSPVIEIGTYAGESAQIFSEYASIVYTIDPWVEYEEATYYGLNVAEARRWFFTHVMANDHENKIKPLQITSEQASKIFAPWSVPFVYLDGWHKFISDDIDLWWPKIESGGSLAGHDYNKERFPDMIKSIEKKLGGPDKVFQDESWVVKKHG